MTKTDPANSRSSQVYESAIDPWIALVLFIGPAVGAGVGIFLLADGNAAGASLLFFIAGMTLILTMAVTIPCRYTLLDDALSIRCGLICYQIPLHQIQAVDPSATLRSGPALSLRRVVVRTPKKQHILSPKDRDRFIREVKQAIESLSE
ncbi:MAG: PH domain-containing protein [Pirellulales bacterium]|nr:PH domain-containing protein [Pirellulales bacterium]